MAIMATLTEFIQQYFSFLSKMITLLIGTCIILIILFALTVLFLRFWLKKRSSTLLPHLRKNSKGERTLVVGFFHPYCNAGGGGERVLWIAIKTLQVKYPGIKCLVYTGDLGVTGNDIMEKARQRFNIALPSSVEFIFLKRRKWVEAKKYPFFTLLGQSIGSVILGMEALWSYVPDIYIDSMGYAFTIPLFKYFGRCTVGCYVHYPTISTDMLNRVHQRQQTYNNASFISRSAVLSSAKLVYYKLFAYFYGLAGKRSHFIMVNSSWTFRHIEELWKSPSTGKTFIVYPPCDVKELMKIPLTDEQDKTVVSVAQFRPEKNHQLQLQAFHLFLSMVEEKNPRDKNNYKMLLVGSGRNLEDIQRVESLKSMCSALELENNVEFRLNVSFDELKELMSKSMIGLHTMLDEHFGIGVVELMAAGTVILAHNSGGPKLDIVVPYNDNVTGFLADDVQSYANAMYKIFNMTSTERMEIRMNARESISRFSEDEFKNGFLHVLEPVLKSRHSLL